MDRSKHATNYANHLASCFAAFVDSGIHVDPKSYPVSIRRYVVAKYFEIPACKTLLIADDAVQEEYKLLGFHPWKHYIPCNSNNMLERLEYVMNLPLNEAQVIVDAAYEIVKQHTLERRVETILTAIENTIHCA